MLLKSIPNLIFALAISMSVPVYAAAAPQDSNAEADAKPPRDQRPPKPDLSEAAAQLGISEDDLHAALRASGGPPPDLAKAADSLGISEEDLKAALPERPRPPRRPQ